MSAVSAISRTNALTTIAQALHLPPECAATDTLSNALIAQSIRRSIFVEAPCSYQTIRALVTGALLPFVDDQSTFEERVNQSIEDLVAAGDVLEMGPESVDSNKVLLRPAPPAFVARKDGSFVILGVAGDDITPIDEQVVSYRPSGLRIVTPSDSQACHQTLLATGLIELPDAVWLHAPAAVSAADFRNGWIDKLPDTRKPETIVDLEVLDPGEPTSFYKGRWNPLSDKHTGIFLARRHQRYGARLWSLVDVAGGTIQRLVDIRAKDARFRDCDEAWRILAAFDAVAGVPQKMALSTSNGISRIKFYSPLPAWAVRRLSLIGESVSPERALLEFAVPSENLKNEVLWLEQMLWLTHETGESA